MLKRFATYMAALAISAMVGTASADSPTKLHIAAVLSAGKEAPWEKSLIDSFNRIIAAKPHGLEISVDYTENVYDNAEEVFRTYADTGEYDIVFGDTAYADAIDKVRGDFPDTMFVMTGSGNRGLGGNAYWIFIHNHEPTYAMGVLAGEMTKSNTIGVISTFPAEDTNDQINAFIAGAKEANPAAKAKITFIQSWFDPQKSNEATTAQVAAGADQIFQMSGAFEVCQQKKVDCYGNYIDMSSAAPDAILASAVAKWDPHLNWLIDQWWQAKTSGGKFNAPTEPTWFGWKDGAGDIVVNKALEAKIPADAKAAMDKTAEAIKSGSKKVQLDLSEPKAE
ncbi:BMP family ABC transporter substrate-binding protein [Dongia soli]|uniref:BMP family ABC transporter substrate-binding protein n=1 Tax=Dongia soli TaxID=600628 RepID=A0ABU5E5D6_9PROT|nr:BMP family ABC transporter substrate-binding protein [Dongia soli]MDY0881476.1 BMP family ABC transporter substrate-binding protein [Dongia soli]